MKQNIFRQIFIACPILYFGGVTNPVQAAPNYPTALAPVKVRSSTYCNFFSCGAFPDNKSDNFVS